jgi:hypothetical protein
MGRIDLDDETYALVRFAAQAFEVSESEVVARAVRRLSSDPEPSASDPWEPVDLYAEYEGHRVEATYLPATRRLTVTSPPVAGETFTTPSAAARAVVLGLNPDRSAAQTNGWRFWRVAATHQRLDVLRARAPAGG